MVFRTTYIDLALPVGFQAISHTLEHNPTGFSVECADVFGEIDRVNKPYLALWFAGKSIALPGFLNLMAQYYTPGSQSYLPKAAEDLFLKITSIQTYKMHGFVLKGSLPEVSESNTNNMVPFWHLNPKLDDDTKHMINDPALNVGSVFTIHRRPDNSGVPCIAISLFSNSFVDSETLPVLNEQIKDGRIISPLTMHIGNIFRAASHVVTGTQTPYLIKRYCSEGTVV